MLKKSFILFSCILTGFGTQEAHAYQNPEETRGRCTYIDTARQYLKPKSVIRLWGDCPLVSCSMLLA